jgi:AcrR family transcriptional regulator
MTPRSPDLPFFVSAEDPPARQRILVEGLRLFTDKGICETTVRDIAEATGFTNPALYRHFESKDALATFLMERCYGRMVTDVQSALKDAPPGPESMRAFVSAVLRLYSESPPALLFLSDNVRRFWPQFPAKLRSFTLVSTARKIVAPRVRPGADDDVEAQVATIVGALQQIFRMLYLGLVAGPPERWVEPLTNTFAAFMPADSSQRARPL